MAPTSPERLQPAWRPGPFIPGRDWTRASRRVGLQQFCRAQISLPAQSEPLAGRGICCLTFLIYTSPPSHTHTQFCSPPFQTLLSRSTTEGQKKERELGRRTERAHQRDMFNRVWGTLCIRVAAVGLELFISLPLSIRLMISGSQKGECGLKTQGYVTPSSSVYLLACLFHPL